MNRKLTALMVGGVLVCVLGTQAMAAEGPQNVEAVPISAVLDQEIPSVPASVLYYGTVRTIGKDEDGTIVRLLLESERYGAYIMNVDAQTVWIDSGNRTASNPADLEEGESLYVFHSAVSTRSMPPQSAAFAVVRNIPMDAGTAMYHEVERVDRLADDSLRIITDNGSLHISVDGKTELNRYQDSETVTLDQLRAGDRIMAWYGAVQETYPARANAGHILVLPRQEAVPQEGAQLTMELDGRVPNMVGRYENGVAMVPLAAVAQALGFDVTYTPGEDGALVTVESETFRVNLYIGQKLIFGTTKIEGAVGTTGPQNYGKDAYIVAPGTTWAPAQLFQMLGKTVTLDGTNLVIK